MGKQGTELGARGQHPAMGKINNSGRISVVILIVPQNLSVGIACRVNKQLLSSGIVIIIETLNICGITPRTTFRGIMQSNHPADTIRLNIIHDTLTAIWCCIEVSYTQILRFGRHDTK